MYIDTLTYEQFMMLGDAELSRRFSMQDEAEQKAKIDCILKLLIAKYAMMKQNRRQRLTGSRQMSLSMLMNRRSQMLQKVLTLLVEVLVLSL